MPIPPDLDGDTPRAIRELLVKLGVDIGFWTAHADRIEQDEAFVRESAAKVDSDLDEWRVILKQAVSLRDYEGDTSKASDEKKRLRAQSASLADDIATALEDSRDEEVSELVKDAVDGPGEGGTALRDVRGFPGQLVLVGDSLATRGRVNAAKDVYSLAVDLAKTPQSQMEIGYLLASRGSIKSPGNWGYGDFGDSPAILLLPEWWMGHAGLPYFEVVYEELLPGPAFPDPLSVLRLALESYGRVFGYCYPAAESGSTDASYESPAGSLGPFLVDGLHALLASVDEYDMNLVWACLQTLFEYTSGSVQPHIVDRLRVSEAYLHGFEVGRVSAQTAEKADRNLRRTPVIDSDALRAGMRKDIAEVIRALPARERNEIEEFFRDRLGPQWWGACPQGVRLYLIDAEQEFRRKLASRSADFRMAVCSYGSTVESHLRWITHLTNNTLGDFAKDRCLSLLADKLKPRAPIPTLRHEIMELARFRNRACHGGADYEVIPEGEADGARSVALSIVKILLRQRKDAADATRG